MRSVITNGPLPLLQVPPEKDARRRETAPVVFNDQIPSGISGAESDQHLTGSAMLATFTNASWTMRAISRITGWGMLSSISLRRSGQKFPFRAGTSLQYLPKSATICENQRPGISSAASVRATLEPLHEAVPGSVPIRWLAS